MGDEVQTGLVHLPGSLWVLVEEVEEVYYHIMSFM